MHSITASFKNCIHANRKEVHHIRYAMDSESGGEVVITARYQWTVNGENVGTFEPASILASLPGIGDNHPTQLNGKAIRQLRRCQQDDDGNDVGGFFVVSDAGAALLIDDPKNAIRWANDRKHVNTDIAPSLTYIPSGNTQVTLFKLT